MIKMQMNFIGMIIASRTFCSSSDTKTHYDILELKPNATHSQIKSAYYELSKVFHPDKNSGNADKFRKINDAYQVLSNVKSRKFYDQTVLNIRKPTENLSTSSRYKSSPSQTYEYRRRDRPMYYNVNEWNRAHYSYSYKQYSYNQSKTYRNVAQMSGPTGMQLFLIFLACIVLFTTHSGRDIEEYKFREANRRK